MAKRFSSRWVLAWLVGFLLPAISQSALAQQGITFEDGDSNAPQLRGFKPGTYVARIESTTQGCRDIDIGSLEADFEEIRGRWKHPRGRGTIRITLKDNRIGVEWSGNPVLYTSEEIQISGKSVFITSAIKHSFGRCDISIKLPNILN